MYTPYDLENMSDEEFDQLSDEVLDIIKETMTIEVSEDFIERYNFLYEQGKEFITSFAKVDKNLWEDFFLSIDLDEGQTIENDFIQATYFACMTDVNEIVDFNDTNNDLLAIAYVLICKSDKSKCSIIYCDIS